MPSNNIERTPNGIAINRRKSSQSIPVIYRVIAPGGHPMEGKCVLETSNIEDARHQRRKLKGYVTDQFGIRIEV